MCVFLDGVEKRGAAGFVQCAGRVLRLAPGKERGIVLDLKARDGLELCDRIGQYLQLPTSSCPWSFADDGQLKSITLTASSNLAVPAPVGCSDLRMLFVRTVPDGERYASQLAHELELFRTKDLGLPVVRALEVLALAGDEVPHVTRGSCGSSLVCYLLGISHVDPVRHNVRFARFLNEFRTSLPDIDFDFPSNGRADVFLRMAVKWGDKVARISNHVHYHEKSALRAALRKRGHKSNVGVQDLPAFMRSLGRTEKEAVLRQAKELEGTFNCYSLHCGGVVYYPDGVPSEALLGSKSKGPLSQVKLDKRDAASDGLFKIDVLSSRALAQLVVASNGEPFTMDEAPFTCEMQEAFETGNNLGVTLAESPLCRMQFRETNPKSVEDVAACLALIRPAARGSSGSIVYEDDAIDIISKACGCSEARADHLRRGLAKNCPDTRRTLSKALGKRRFKELDKELGTPGSTGSARPTRCPTHSSCAG